MNLTLQSIKGLVAALLFVSVASCSGSGSNTPTGTLTFWADESTKVCPNVRVSLDGVDLGPLTFRVPAPAKCGDFSDPLAISRIVAEGTHTVTATNGTPQCTWAPKDYKVAADSCQLIELLIVPGP